MIMAKQVITLLTDDLDGGEADRTIEFALDGVAYTIELSEKNIGLLRKALDPYLDAGRRVGRATYQPFPSTRRLGRSGPATRRSRHNPESSSPPQSRTSAPAAVTPRQAAVPTGRQLNQAIRRWAAENDIPLAARGRIPRTVVEQYHA